MGRLIVFVAPVGNFSVAVLEVLSGHWLAPIVFLPNPRALIACFSIWRDLVDVLVVSWLQSVGLACPRDAFRNYSGCLGLAREGY